MKPDYVSRSLFMKVVADLMADVQRMREQVAEMEQRVNAPRPARQEVTQEGNVVYLGDR